MIDHVEVLGFGVWKIDELVRAFRQLLTVWSSNHSYTVLERLMCF
jgi:hypothetical protein